MSNKPKFDPKKPFEVVGEKPEKPKFDKKKGFSEYMDEAMEGEAQMQRDQDDLVSDLALLGTHGASMGFSDEIAGGMSKIAGGDYEESRDAMRDKISQAREKRGFVGDMAETGGSMATSLVVPSLRGGTFLKEVALSAIQGAGEADEMEDVVEQAGKSTLISGASQIAIKGTADKLFGNPDDILANTSGARGLNRQKAGVLPSQRGSNYSKDPADIANRLDKIGFFKPGDRMFDPNMKKFVVNPVPKKGKLESYVQPTSMDELLRRTEMMTSELGKQNALLLKGKKIPVSEVDNVLVDTAIDFTPAGSGIQERLKVAQAVVAETVSDLRARGAIKNGFIDAAEIQKTKQFMQEKVAKSYENQAMSEITNDAVEARRLYATKLDDLLDKYGGPEYAANNDLMRDTFQQRKFIFNKDSRMRGESVSGAKLTRPSISDHVMDVVDNPTTGFLRAKVGQGLEKPTGKAMLDAATRLPVEMYNNRETPRVPYRAPNSVQNIPEQLIRTPLPRTTQGLMENKNFVLAKVAQMAPDLLEAVKDTYDHDPEMLSELAPIIAQRLPHFFMRDKYNRFDGRIMSEADKNLAIKDTLSDTKLSTIEQAKIITRLNKEGLYDR